MVSLGLTKVIFELDCKLVVDRVKNMFKDDSEVGVMITQCRNLLSLYPNFSVDFVKRQR